MPDYTLVMRIRFNAVDDVQARRSAQELLDQMRQRDACPDAELVLRRQGRDANRNLLADNA